MAAPCCFANNALINYCACASGYDRAIKDHTKLMFFSFTVRKSRFLFVLKKLLARSGAEDVLAKSTWALGTSYGLRWRVGVDVHYKIVSVLKVML